MITEAPQSGPAHASAALGWLGTTLIAAAVLAAFWPALRAPPPVTDAAGVLPPNGLQPAFHRVAELALRVNLRLAGDTPAAVHAVSVGLHALNAVLVFLLARRLLKAAFPPQASNAVALGAVAAATLWALHPLRVEAVVWTAQRGELLAALFLLAGTHAYLPAAVPRRATAITLATLGYLAALAAAPVALGWPVVLILLDAFPLRRLRSKSAWHEKLPLLAVAVMATVLVLGGRAANPLFPPPSDTTPARFIQLTWCLVQPVWTTLKPLPLLPFYELTPPFLWTEPRFILAAALLAAGFVALFVTARRLPALAVGGSSYLVLVLPTTLLTLPNQAGADHLTYATTLPLFVLLGAAVPYAAARFGRAGRTGCVVGFAGLAVVLGTLTARQCGFWRTPRDLWQYVYTHAAQSAAVRFHYARLLLDDGELPNAAQLFLSAAARRSDWLAAQLATGETQLLMHAYEDAARAFARAIQLAPRDPRGYQGRAAALAANGQLQDAEPLLQRAIELDPKNPHFLASLGHLLMAQQRWAEAAATFARACTLAPEDRALANDLARAKALADGG